MPLEKRASRAGAAIAVGALTLAAAGYLTGLVGGHPRPWVGPASANVEEKNSSQSRTSGHAPAGAAARDAVISGTGIKHSTSMLAAVGGATTEQGAAVLNGTSMRPRRP